MKKLISLCLSSMICAGIYAQGADTPVKTDKQQSHAAKKMKDQDKTASLEGRSFRVTFTEKPSDVKTTEAGVLDNNPVTLNKNNSSMLDAGSKVMLTFSNGNLLSPLFDETGCPYHLNTSGEGMYAFSAYCRLSSGSETGKTQANPSQDTKLEIDADRQNSGNIQQHDAADVTGQPNAMAADETKQHLPSGTLEQENEKANGNSTVPVAPPAADKTDNLQRQSENSVQAKTGSMASISGVVTGNAIQGTLSWKDSDGRLVSYSYTGSVASKKDLNDSHVVGMK
jgi:hypothetical protein